MNDQTVTVDVPGLRLLAGTFAMPPVTGDDLTALLNVVEAAHQVEVFVYDHKRPESAAEEAVRLDEVLRDALARLVFEDTGP